MPVAFTEEERDIIHDKLLEAAFLYVKEQRVSKITIEQLTNYAHISKGAFYLFFDSKELLFYELLRQLHHEVYGPAIAALTEGNGTPAERLCNSILLGCRALDCSGMLRFWDEDAPQLLRAIPVEKKADQIEREKALFNLFLKQSGRLCVEPELAYNAIRSLILTAPMRHQLGNHYETVLRWMAQGICDKIFE